MRQQTVNLQPLSSLMGNLCLSTACCGDCNDSKCLVAFWFNVLAMPQKEFEAALQTFSNTLPCSDEKNYAKEIALKCQTMVLLQCENCRQEHHEDCIINLLRRTFHYFITHTWENGSYHYTSITQYLRHLIRENHEDGLRLLNYYRKCKHEAFA